MAPSVRAFSALILVGAFLTGPAGAATNYHLRVRAVPSIAQRLVFSLTCSDSTNEVAILNAEHDGQGIVTSTEGGPILGRLLGGFNPADSTLMVGGSFYSEINLRLSNFTVFDCDITLSEVAAADTVAPSQCALYWRDTDDRVRIATQDPFGADAIAAIDITGVPGGELSVFYPLTFVAPDTLLLAGDVVSVPRSIGRSGEMRLLAVSPSPTAGSVRLGFFLPEPGELSLNVYDVAGRRMSETMLVHRAAGLGELVWSGRNRMGGRVPAGVYIAQLRFGSKSVVRRFVVAR